MHSWLPRLPVWIIEGAAEYLTAGRYAPGRLSLRAYGKNLEQNGAGGREVRTTDLETLMAMDYPTWIGELAKGGAERNYRSAMLLFYYFCHEDGDQTGQHLIDYFQSRKVSRGPTRRIAKNTCSGAGMRRLCGRISSGDLPALESVLSSGVHGNSDAGPGGTQAVQMHLGGGFHAGQHIINCLAAQAHQLSTDDFRHEVGGDFQNGCGSAAVQTLT